MKVLVTGCAGQVGRELGKLQSDSNIEFVMMDSASLDIGDAVQVSRYFNRNRLDGVINAAAWTDVDRAESNSAAAYRCNRDGAGIIASACESAHIPLVHFSTDYVFDGRKPSPYSELDEPSPINVYGASKLAGEHLVRELCRSHYILRTSWIFSAHGKNFVKSILRKAASDDKLSVVADQRGKPTSAAELARISVRLLSERTRNWGTYHFSQPEPISWYEFAKAIVSEALRQGFSLRVTAINAVAAQEYVAPASRPANSVLDCTKVCDSLSLTIPAWNESLVPVLAEIRENGLLT